MQLAADIYVGPSQLESMSITESEFAQALIQYHREDQEKMNKHQPVPEEVHIYPEAHYNHYGNRGIADLYVITGDWDGHLYELKSESAVRQATGANEIIRQFNKMREFFFSGSSHKPPTKWMDFELCFTPTEYNFRHLAENADLYATITQQDLSGLNIDQLGTSITVRPPDADNITPVIMFAGNVDFRTYPERSDDNRFIEYVESNQPALFEEYEEVLREIVRSTSS
jgi:hypothetical protein